MGGLGGPRLSCPAQETCSAWVFDYLGDCVCTTRDAVSFALGMASVLSWGVAEVPQIVANFLAGNTEGVSLTFLLTWTFGDFFNLAGCYLEPATLPTQFYMAVLYTITTIVLVAQSVWYEILFPRMEGKAVPAAETEQPLLSDRSEDPPPPTSPMDMGPPPPATSYPLSVPAHPLTRKSSSNNIYISSARSLASSYTPTMGSFVPGSGGHHVGSLLSQSPGQGIPHGQINSGGSVIRALAFGALLLGGMRMSSQLDQLLNPSSSLVTPGDGFGRGYVLSDSGRKLLQSSQPSSIYPPTRGFPHTRLTEGSDSSSLGQILGWLMSAIYMGGRLPQIYLNGLSPLMFLFALTGNVTYVASIVVRSTAWVNLQPNLPWIVDAGVCVLLDLFILCQFGYYSYINKKEKDAEEYEYLK